MRTYRLLRAAGIACQLTSTLMGQAPTYRSETLFGAWPQGAVKGLEWNINSRIVNVAVGRDGSVWYVEGEALYKLTPDGLLRKIAAQAVPGCLSNPSANSGYHLALSPDEIPHIHDPLRMSIRRIQPDGAQEIVAGQCGRLPAGDGGPAKAAGIGSVGSMVIDLRGNIYFSDLGMGTIRKIDTAGTITKFATQPGVSGLAIDSQGTLFGVNQRAPHQIFRFDADGSAKPFALGNGAPSFVLDQLVIDGAGVFYGKALGGPQPILRMAPGAKFLPMPDTVSQGGFAADGAGTLFSATDLFYLTAFDAQGRKRRLVGTGRTATQAAQFKYAEIGQVSSATLPNSRGTWISDDSNTSGGVYLLTESALRKLENTTGFAVNGQGILPASYLIQDPAGKLLMLGRFFIFEMTDPPDGAFRALKQTGEGNFGSFALGVQDQIYVPSLTQRVVRQLSRGTGEVTVVAGDGTEGDSGDGGPALAARFRGPLGVAADLAGSIYIADFRAHRVRKVDPTGKITTIAGTGAKRTATDNGGPGRALNTPVAVATDVLGNVYIGEAPLYSGDLGREESPGGRILMIDRRGTLQVIAGGMSNTRTEDGTLASQLYLKAVTDIRVANDGTIYLTDGRRRIIRLVPESTEFPRAASSGILNGASNSPGAVAPGMILTIFGKNIGPDTLARGALMNGKLGTEAGQVQVLFDGKPAPVLYAAANQVGVVAPYGLTPGTRTRIVVLFNRAESVPVEIEVAGARPGLFTSDSSGKGPGAFLNQDGSVNSAGNPAKAGSVVVLFGTGEGATTPVGIDGGLASGPNLARPVLPVSVTICGQGSEVLYAGAAPSSVAGLLQVNARMPATCPAPGPAEVILSVGSVRSQAGVTIAVEP